MSFLSNPVPGPEEPALAGVAPRLREDPPWTLKDVLRLALVALLTIVAFSGLALVGLARWTGSDDPGSELAKDPWLLVPVMAASYVVILVFMVLLVTRHYRRSFGAAVRWNFPALPRATGFLAAGVALAVLVQAGSSLLPMPRQPPIDRFFRDASSAWLMAAFGTLLAPPVEELFFRGFLYPALARRAGMAASEIGRAHV